jgi:hypothetical protein
MKIEQNKKCNPFYTVWIRPPGSLVWTQLMSGQAPYRASGNRANEMAMHVAAQCKYCARVVKIDLPPEPDCELYAMLADGETKYKIIDHENNHRN